MIPGPFFLILNLAPDCVEWELRDSAVDGERVANGESSTWAAATYVAGQALMDHVRGQR